MIIKSTELQNNFEKYLELTSQEEIIITYDGRPVAKLVPITYGKELTERWPSWEVIHESVGDYKYNDSLGFATYEEFLELTKDSEERYEYIDGQIFLLASPKMDHQYASMELSFQFRLWSQEKSCRPFAAPFEIKLKHKNQMNSVQPDLMIICDLEEHMGDDGFYNGVPTLIVEVLSDSTRNKDLRYKANLYIEAGVTEYWIVDPKKKEITVYVFEDKEVKDTAHYKENDTLRSFTFTELAFELKKIFI